jgi:LysM repeat protein
MNLTNITEKIKNSLSDSADKFLSAKFKDELGLNRPTVDSLMKLSQNINIKNEEIDKSLNHFYKPVNSNFLSNRDYKNIKRWAIIGISVISLALLVLFASILVPQQDYFKVLENSKVIVKGKELSPEQAKRVAEAKISEASAEEPSTIGDMRTTNIEVSKPAETNLIEDSISEVKEEIKKVTETKLKQVAPAPIKTTPKASPNSYTVRSGDNLDTIARRVYGRSNPALINKIKAANAIRNPRNIQVGRRLTMPAL